VLSESSLATPSANADEDWKTLQHELARAPGVARATTLLQQFVQQHPNHSTAHAILARKLADQGQESAAHTHAEQALAADPLCVEATYLLAQIGEQRRDLDTALYYYRRVRYLDPNSVAGWLGLARIWQQLARPVEARRAYRSLLHVLDTLPATEPIPGLEHATVAEVSAFAHQQMALLQSQ
jgi:chemotaxis protein methyltransferase CheR